MTSGGIPLVRTAEHTATVPDAIDTVLARGELTGLHVTRPRAKGTRQA